MQRVSARRRTQYPQAGSGFTPVSRTMPFDYVVEFPISGNPGQSRESVINISPDGPYTAAAISYGFDQERGVSLGGFASFTNAIAPGALTLGQFPTASLLDGLRVNPKFVPVVFEVRATENGLVPARYSTAPVSAAQLNSSRIFERVVPPTPIDFFLSITDTASGRELQAQPSFSVATLGESSGRRPFRALPAPVRLDARSSLRFQIIERTPNVSGTLFINLIGYHEFVGGCSPQSRSFGPADDPGARLIPFDYVSRLALTGQADRRVEHEIIVDGSFVASSISYGLQTDSADIPIASAPGSGGLDLSNVRLDELPIRALVEGFRVRPEMTRFAFLDGGLLNTSLNPALSGRIFETLNQPESVSFRYSLFDSGAGRELQNQAVHNIAGLGSAGGERPFKRFARPLRLEPSSTFRVSVVERFGRGELFVVLQGHRALAGAMR